MVHNSSCCRNDCIWVHEYVYLVQDRRWSTRRNDCDRERRCTWPNTLFYIPRDWWSSEYTIWNVGLNRKCNKENIWQLRGNIFRCNLILVVSNKSYGTGSMIVPSNFNWTTWRPSWPLVDEILLMPIKLLSAKMWSTPCLRNKDCQFMLLWC